MLWNNIGYVWKYLSIPKLFLLNPQFVTWGRFDQHFTQRFNAHRSQKHKNTVKLSVFFLSWDMHV